MRKLTHQDFDHMVKFFDSMVQTSWLSDIHQQIAEWIPSQENLQVVDIGCGTGRFLQRIYPRIQRGVGVDLSAEMIKEAKHQAREHKLDDKLHFLVGDAYKLPLDEEQFDVAISTCVMFLLPEPEKGIREMVRVLKRNGVLLMLNPSPKMSPQAAIDYAHEQQLSEPEVEYILKWSDVSTKKHRYHRRELEQLLAQQQLSDIEICEVLDGLAHITIAVKE